MSPFSALNINVINVPL